VSAGEAFAYGPNVVQIPNQKARASQATHDWKPLSTSKPCEVHGEHRPKSHVNHYHHVWPLGEGGPDIPANKVVICPTGHYNVHEMLSKAIKAGRWLNASERYGYHRGEQDLARLGYWRVVNGKME
jgi:hypothetical protein